MSSVPASEEGRHIGESGLAMHQKRMPGIIRRSLTNSILILTQSTNELPEYISIF